MTGTVGDRAAGARAWAELLRLPAVLTVPGDALAGAAATGRRPGWHTAAAAGTSMCLYLAGMALNDWADREEDARERPHRPLPSGRIAPRAALGAAVALTGAGLGLAAPAGRAAFGTATALAGTVWAYDLGLKHTRAAPATMAAARALDLLLGAVATRAGTAAATAGRGPEATPPGRPATRSRRPGSRHHSETGSLAPAPPGAPGSPARPPAGTGPGTSAPGPGRGRSGASSPGRRPANRLARRAPWPGATRYGEAVAAAVLLGAHTLAVTTVSRNETTGGSSAAPLGALAAVGGITAATSRPRGRGLPGITARAAAAAYAATAARPLTHAALNPSPPLTQRAVGSGIRAMVPLQAALAARSGAPGSALAIAALAPLARRLARKVSLT